MSTGESHAVTRAGIYAGTPCAARRFWKLLVEGGSKGAPGTAHAHAGHAVGDAGHGGGRPTCPGMTR